MRVPTLIPWRDGLHVYAYPGDEACQALFVTGCYEPNEFCLLDRILEPGMTFVDLGANMGLYTLFAARKVAPKGMVLAIEPSSRDFQRLKRNVEANALPNVRLLQMAVFDRPSEADLLIAAEARSGHNTLGAFSYDTPLAKKERVRLERLDDIIQQEGFEGLDVIKLDIEGAEYSALQGATQTLERFGPIVLMELSDRSLQHQGHTSSQVWEFLCHSGYQLFGFDEHTGLPVPARRKPFFDSENIVAVRNFGGASVPW